MTTIPKEKRKPAPIKLKFLREGGIMVVPSTALVWFVGKPAFYADVESVMTGFRRERMLAEATSQQTGHEYYADVNTGTIYDKHTGECKSSYSLRLCLPVRKSTKLVPKRAKDKFGSFDSINSEGADE